MTAQQTKTISGLILQGLDCKQWGGPAPAANSRRKGSRICSSRITCRRRRRLHHHPESPKWEHELRLRKAWVRMRHCARLRTAFVLLSYWIHGHIPGQIIFFLFDFWTCEECRRTLFCFSSSVCCYKSREAPRLSALHCFKRQCSHLSETERKNQHKMNRRARQYFRAIRKMRTSLQ